MLQNNYVTFVVALDGWSESSLVSYIAGVLSVLGFDNGLECVVHLAPHDHGLSEGLRSDGKDHELLEGKAIAGMRATWS
jgi:hypothetical protein